MVGGVGPWFAGRGRAKSICGNSFITTRSYIESYFRAKINSIESYLSSSRSKSIVLID